MNSAAENSEPENKLWLVCPLCKRPNPAGVKYCQHCWGASLYTAQPVSEEKATAALKRWQTHLQRLNRIKIVAVSIIAPLMLAFAVFLVLYLFTDKILAPPADVNSSPLPGEWTMFRRDLGHSGSTAPGTTLPEGTLKWTFSTGDQIHSSPTVVDGIVYVGSRDNKLYALDAETGEKLWEYETRAGRVESSPAVVNGVLYFGANDSQFYALDAETGEKLWDFDVEAVVTSSPAVADGIVYFGATNSRVYALDAKTGTRLWDFKADGWVTSSPAVANGIVYFGSNRGSLYALHAKSGRLRLRFRILKGVMSSPAVSDGVVYFNSGGVLWAVDGSARNWPFENHAIKGYWVQLYVFRLAPPPPPKSGFLWGLNLDTSSSASTSSPIVTDGTVYTSIDNRLYSIDIESREINWGFSAGGKISSSGALGDNIIYVGSENGLVYAVDATSGEEIWNFPAGNKITSSPALVDGTIYIGSHDGNLYAIE